MNNQNSNKITERILDGIVAIFEATGAAIIKSLLWLAKHVWKPYFGIETPLYKIWWKSHAKCMQAKLDKCHGVVR